ncbi:MAG TPA: cupredoxin domain-containing protein [Thermomicrobiales bacterium]|jgi:uncharacterized cupredoxin-like copper-binding protein
MNKGRLRGSVAVLLATGVLASCGGKHEKKDLAPTTGPVTASADTALASPEISVSASPSPAVASPTNGLSTEITVELVDVAFRPERLAIPAGTVVTVSLLNTGKLLHNFNVDALNISQDVAAGTTRRITIDAPAGTYQFYCNVPGHKESGMVGTLVVT